MELPVLSHECMQSPDIGKVPERRLSHLGHPSNAASSNFYAMSTEMATLGEGCFSRVTQIRIYGFVLFPS